MKKSHFTETQILAAIQKQEKGIAVKDIVRDIESELSAYKKLVGELEFENRAMKALIEKKL